jgi:predicted transposase/invertase (TIGR01784 family)
MRVWKMRLIPIDEAVREIQIRDAREEGMERGMEKGMEKGMEQSKFEIARNFLKIGLPVGQIAKGTGLSVEEIRALGE